VNSIVDSDPAQQAAEQLASINIASPVDNVSNPRHRKRGRYQSVSKHDRETIINLKINNSLKGKQIATALSNRVKPKTVYSILEAFYKEDGRKLKKRKGGSSKRYTEEERKKVDELQLAHPNWTYNQIRTEWKRQTVRN
jgi:transposase